MTSLVFIPLFNSSSIRSGVVYEHSSPTGLFLFSTMSRNLSSSGGDSSVIPDDSLDDFPNDDPGDEKGPDIPGSDLESEPSPKDVSNERDIITDETEVPSDNDVRSLPSPSHDSHDGVDFTDPKSRSYIDYLNDIFVYGQVFDSKISTYILKWNIISVLGERDSFKIIDEANFYESTKNHASTAFTVWWDVLSHFITSIYSLYDKCNVLSEYDINQLTLYVHNQGGIAFMAFYDCLKLIPRAIGYAINGLAIGCYDLIYLLPVLDEEGKDPVNIKDECKVEITLRYNIKGGGAPDNKVSGIKLNVNGCEPKTFECHHEPDFVRDDVNVKRVPQSHTSLKRRSAYDEAKLFGIHLDIRDILVTRYSEGTSHNTTFITQGDGQATYERTVKTSSAKEHAVESIDSHPRFIMALYAFVHLDSIGILDNKFVNEQVVSYLLGQFVHILQAGRATTVNNDIQYASITVNWTLSSSNVPSTKSFQQLVLSGLFRPASKLHFGLFKGFDINKVKSQIVYSTLLNLEFNSTLLDIVPYSTGVANNMFSNYMNIKSKLDLNPKGSNGLQLPLSTNLEIIHSPKEWFIKEMAVRQLIGDNTPSNLPMLSVGSLTRADGKLMPAIPISNECIELTPFKVDDIQSIHEDILETIFPDKEFKYFRKHYGIFLSNCKFLTKSFTP